MKNRKQYKLVEKDGEYRAAVVGEPTDTRYITTKKKDAMPEETKKQKEAALAEVDKMNTTFSTSDYAQDEIDAFWDMLDLAPVNEFFSKILKLKVNLEKVRSDTRGRIHYELEDKTNIAAENPITNAAWQEMRVNTFGSGMTVNHETGALIYWGEINLRYSHHGGGSNGAKIGGVWFTNGSWIIQAECGKHACKYCGRIADGKDTDELCAECRK